MRTRVAYKHGGGNSGRGLANKSAAAAVPGNPPLAASPSTIQLIPPGGLSFSLTYPPGRLRIQFMSKRTRSPDSVSLPATQTTPARDIQNGGSLATAPLTPTSPPAKRPKLSFRQHASHWGPNGDIFIQIQDSRFKLYQSQLGKHSSYFRRVLETHAEGDNGLNEVIFLDKTGVKFTDFETLLDALEDFVDYFYTPPPFATVKSILRAATALSFDKYKTWAQRYLTDMWSTSLSQLSVTCIPHAIESLALARECDVPAILKRVFYELVRSPNFGQQPGRPRLSCADLDVLSTARKELTACWLDTIATPFASIDRPAACAPECTMRDTARAEVACTKLIHDSKVCRAFVWDPVCGLQALAELGWAGVGFCPECVELLRTSMGWRTKREEVWEKLDGMFCLTAYDVE